MRGPLAGYLRGQLAGQIFGVLLAFTALLQLLDLMDATGDILDRHLGLSGVLHYSALRLPAVVALALPLACLIGALFCFHGLARRQELVAMRASGITQRRVVLALLPVVAVIAVLQAALAERLLPYSEARLAEWWSSTTPPGEESEAPPTLWLRADVGLVSTRLPSGDGQKLQDLRVYRRDAQGNYTGRLFAETGVWAGDHWNLQNVDERIIGSDPVHRHQASVEWMVNLKPADLLRASGSSTSLSSAALVRIIEGRSVAVRPAAYYQTSLFRKRAAPLILLVMLLLALPAARVQARSSEGGGQLIVALCCGLALVLLDGLLAALAQGGHLPPLMATLCSPLIFGVLGAYWLWKADQ